MDAVCCISLSGYCDGDASQPFPSPKHHPFICSWLNIVSTTDLYQDRISVALSFVCRRSRSHILCPRIFCANCVASWCQYRCVRGVRAGYHHNSFITVAVSSAASVRLRQLLYCTFAALSAMRTLPALREFHLQIHDPVYKTTMPRVVVLHHIVFYTSSQTNRAISGEVLNRARPLNEIVALAC